MAGYPALETLLCHCEIDDSGHSLGTPGCSSEIKQGRYNDGWCELDHGSEPLHTKCHGSARGTCPECGKKIKVVRIEMRDHANGRLLYGAATPGMAPHKLAGKECPGTGRVPTETTFTPGYALREYLAAQVEVA